MNRIIYRFSEGFTLLELLLVLAIASILLTLAVGGYADYMRDARNDRAMVEMRTLESKLQQYYFDYTRFPDSLDEVGGAPDDPWGNPYQYLNIQNVKGKGKTKGKGKGKDKGKVRKDKNLVPLNSDYDLYSMGEDGKTAAPLTAKASHDDIVRASNGSFIGLATDY